MAWGAYNKEAEYAYVYTKTHQNKLATVGMKRSIQEKAKFVYKIIAALCRIP